MAILMADRGDESSQQLPSFLIASDIAVRMPRKSPIHPLQVLQVMLQVSAAQVEGAVGARGSISCLLSEVLGHRA